MDCADIIITMVHDAGTMDANWAMWPSSTNQEAESKKQLTAACLCFISQSNWFHGEKKYYFSAE
jgi:hypothetical protein